MARTPKVTPGQQGMLATEPASDLSVFGRVVESVERLRARGARIVKGDWGVALHVVEGRRVYRLNHGSCCCALAALIVDRETAVRDEREPIRAVVARELGITVPEVDAIIRGFDHEGATYSVRWEALGRALHDRLLVSP
jgi:hypothetical protein